MKVLWFSNTPANAAGHINKTELKGTGGWMESLDKAVQQELDLHVVFYHNYKSMSFVYEKASYYALRRYKSPLNRLLQIITGHVPDTEDLPRYLKIIEEVKPDLIHIHGTENQFACLIPHVSCPVVVSIQGNLTVIHHKFTSGLGHRFLGTGIRTNKSLYQRFFARTFRKAYQGMEKRKKIEQRNLRACKHIIGRTAWDYRITRVLAPGSAYYHVDEILRDVFYKHQWEPKREKGTLHIFTTNSDNYYKGFETICHAVSLLNSLGVDFVWRVAGVDKEALMVKIVKQKMGVDFPDKNLHLLGSLSAVELVNNMLESDLYVMPSHIENSPNNLCEAMLLGMPCIASFAGGTGSLLQDGKEGILIQDGDPWALAGAVVELNENPGKASKYGERARVRALERHDKKRITSALLGAYKGVVKEK